MRAAARSRVARGPVTGCPRLPRWTPASSRVRRADSFSAAPWTAFTPRSATAERASAGTCGRRTPAVPADGRLPVPLAARQGKGPSLSAGRGASHRVAPGCRAWLGPADPETTGRCFSSAFNRSLISASSLETEIRPGDSGSSSSPEEAGTSESMRKSVLAERNSSSLSQVSGTK